MRLLVCTLCLFLLSACASNTGLDSSTKTPDPVSATDTSGEVGGLSAEAWALSLRVLPLNMQVREAEKMYSRTSAPAFHREMALYILATRPNNSTLFAQEALSRLFTSVDYDKKVQMEKLLLDEVQNVPTSALKAVSEAIDPSVESLYPYIVLVWEASKQNLLVTSSDIFKRVNIQNKFANYSTFDLRRTATSSSFGENLGSIVVNPMPVFEPTCAVLALPMSGSYASISRQIIAGAQSAQKALLTSNIHVSINIIDTEKANWIDEMNALPPICSIVGGPLRSEVLDSAYDSGIMKKKAFFTFMPQLSNRIDETSGSRNKSATRYVEGQNVWRFFTSPHDQIRSILTFAQNTIDADEFASVYPNVQYGEAMSNLFTDIAASEKVLVNQVPYDPESSRWWSETIGDFLGAVTPLGGGLPKVNSTVDAVFFADTWENMHLLAPMLHYQGAVHVPFFGTSLWGQGINDRTKNHMTYLDLAVFPGGWNKYSKTYGALKLQRDLSQQKMQASDWSALGFDFVQMLSALNYNRETIDVKVLNDKLHLLQQLAWAGAPFIWNEKGIAERNLFLFQPNDTGIKLLSTTEFLTRYEARLKEVENYSNFYKREAQKKLIEERRKSIGY